MHQQERFLSPLCFFFSLLVEAFFNSTACFAIFHWNITLHIALNRNSECIPRNLAAGVASESDKINILTSGDSSRLEVYAYLPRGDSI